MAARMQSRRFFGGAGVFWVFLWIFVRGVVFIGIFTGGFGLYIFISPPRWWRSNGGVFLRGASSFFGDRLAIFVYMCTGKVLSFAVFAPFQPEFGTFVSGTIVYMARGEIVEIWGISGVFWILG